MTDIEIYILIYSIVFLLLGISYFTLYRPCIKYAKQVQELTVKVRNSKLDINECKKIKSEIINLHNNIDSLYKGLRIELRELYSYIDGVEKGLTLQNNEKNV